MRKTILLLFTLCLVGIIQAQPVMPTGPTSLECYAAPGYFVTCRNNNQSLRLIEGGDQTDRGRFNIVAGLTGTDTVSFIPVAYADQNRYLRHRGYVIYVETGTDNTFYNDASWTPRPGLADPLNPRLVSFESVNFPGYYLKGDITGNRTMRNNNAVGTDVEKAQATFMFPDPALASNPNPSNGSDEISIDVGKISWVPGDVAVTHTVFFGTEPNSVRDATVGDPMGTTVYQDLALDVNSIDLARLEYGTTYYWRVDETPGTGPGLIWSFDTEPKAINLTFSNIIDVTAETPTSFYETQEPNMTVNRSGLNAQNLHSTSVNDTMWLGVGEVYGDTWIQYEFDQVYKFYEMLVWNYNETDPGQWFGAKDVNVTYSIDGQTWKALDDIVQLNMATGLEDYAANTTVALNGEAAKFIKIIFLDSWMDGIIGGGLSEVRFSVIPTRAQNPNPGNNSNNVAIGTSLSWKPGRDADSHTIYIGSDTNDVKAGIADVIADTDEAMYTPVLELGKTYYWKVDEVNNNEAYPVWDGPVWSFSTVNSILIEGFEVGYDDTEANAVFMTWIDGYDDNSNGSVMGNFNTPFLSSIRHSGSASAPLSYDHTGTATHSEVTAQTADLPIATSDWTIGSPEALVIWFSGEPNNVPAKMYVKLNNTKVFYDDDPIYLTKSAWRPWVIMLSDVSVNFSNITSISIGFDETGNQNEVGTILIDDIALYGFGRAPEIAEPVAPGTDGLIASYSMENNVQDGSGNGLNGTLIGTPTYVQGPAGYGKAMQFSGADAVDLGNKMAFNPEGSFSVALWANIADWSSGWGHVMIGNRGEGTVGWQLRRYSNTNFCFTTRGVGDDDSDSDADPPLNEWVHITCVYDSVAHTKSIYFNGVLDSVANLNDPDTMVGPTTHNTYIGARANSDNTGQEGFFTGMLDEIRIYNRALTAGEAVYLSDPTP